MSRIIFLKMGNALLKRNILIVVANLSLGRRCVNRLRQLVRLFQTFRKSNSANCTILLVACPAASSDISTNDALNRDHIQLAAHHAVSVKLILLEKLRHIFYINRNHVVRQDILGHIKPELGHLCKNSAFLRYFVVQDHIKTADTVCRNHDQAVSVVVNLAYFAFFNWLHFLHSFTPHHFSIFHFCKSPKGMTVSQSQPACFRFYSTQLFYHFADKKTILLNAEIKASFPEIHVNLHM